MGRKKRKKEDFVLSHSCPGLGVLQGQMLKLLPGCSTVGKPTGCAHQGKSQRRWEEEVNVDLPEVNIFSLT